MSRTAKQLSGRVANNSRRYSYLHSSLFSCKVQFSLLFKAWGFLYSKINLAGFPESLIVFYLFTHGFADDQ